MLSTTSFSARPSMSILSETTTNHLTYFHADFQSLSPLYFFPKHLPFSNMYIICYWFICLLVQPSSENVWSMKGGICPPFLFS